MKSILSKISLFLFLLASFHLVACSGGLQSGGLGGDGVMKQGNEVGSNLAAPTQSSGILSPGIDPDPDADGHYRVKFEKGDLSLPGGEKIFLKGTLEKLKADAPNMDGLTLKVVDHRTLKFATVPVTVKQDNAAEAAFAISFKASAFELDDLVSGKVLGFYLSPNPKEEVEVAAAGEMTDCANPLCAGPEWYTVLIKHDENAKPKDAPFVSPGNPAPGSLPINTLERPEGKVPMPGHED